MLIICCHCSTSMQTTQRDGHELRDWVKATIHDTDAYPHFIKIFALDLLILIKIIQINILYIHITE